jgi:O-antigen/teichoic acid export membrane protein
VGQIPDASEAEDSPLNMDSGFEPTGAEAPELEAEVASSTDPSMRGAVARGALWALGGQAAVLVATLVATPFVIRLLWTSEYGLWALLQSALLLLTLGDFGMGVTSTRFASERHADRDPKGEVTVISTAIAISAAITGVAAVVVAAAGPFIVDELLHLHGSLRDHGLLALRLVCIAAVAYGVAGTVSTPQQVRLRWGSLTLATTGPRVVQIALAPLVLVVADTGVVALAVLATAVAVLAAGLNGAVAFHFQPGMRHPKVSRETARKLLRFGGALTLAGLAYVPLSTAERFLLAHYHSTTEVGYYAAAATVGALLLTIPHSLSQVLLPALARLSSAGRTDDHHRLYYQSLKGLFLITVPAALGLAYVARPFLDLWAGPTFGVHSTVPLYIIVGCLCVNTIAYLPYTQVLASGRASTVAKVHLAELAPYLIAAAVLTDRFGAAGAAVAWGGRLVVGSVIFFAIVRRTDGLGWVPTPERAVLSIVALLGLSVALLLAASFTGSLAGRAGVGAVMMAAYVAVAWRAVLTDQERTGLVALGRELMSRRLTAR